eukprot:13948318-Alexandrium_andersonii.AAC.1
MAVWVCGSCNTPHNNSLCQKCRSCGYQRIPPKQPEFDSGRRLMPWVQKNSKDNKAKKSLRTALRPKNEPPPA